LLQQQPFPARASNDLIKIGAQFSGRKNWNKYIAILILLFCMII